MIELLGEKKDEKILVRIEGNKVLFGSTSFGAVLADIDGLKLDYEGVIKEFPDLQDNSEWQEIAKKRFKEKIKSLSNEEQISDYIVKDLKKHGFIFKLKCVKGHRPVRLA